MLDSILLRLQSIDRIGSSWSRPLPLPLSSIHLSGGIEVSIRLGFIATGLGSWHSIHQPFTFHSIFSLPPIWHLYDTSDFKMTSIWHHYDINMTSIWHQLGFKFQAMDNRSGLNLAWIWLESGLNQAVRRATQQEDAVYGQPERRMLGKDAASSGASCGASWGGSGKPIGNLNPSQGRMRPITWFNHPDLTWWITAISAAKLDVADGGRDILPSPSTWPEVVNGENTPSSSSSSSSLPPPHFFLPSGTFKKR